LITSIRIPQLFKQKENFLLLFFCFLIGFTSIKNAIILAVRKAIILPFKLDVIILYLIYGLIILYSIRYVFKKIYKESILILTFLTVFFILAYLQSNPSYLLTVGWQLLLAFIVYLYARATTDFKGLNAVLQYTAPLISFSVFLLIVVFSVNEDTDYSQYTAYLVLPSAVISALVIFSRFSLLHIINTLFSIILMFISGARGPLVCFVLIILIKAIYMLVKNKNYEAFLIWIGILSLPIVLFGIKLLNYFSQLIINKGYSTRLLSFIAKDDVLNETGRDEIRDYVISLIGQHPITGVGLALDRMMINRQIGNPTSVAIGDYPHNFILEILLQYGVILGGVLILLFLRLVYLSFKRSSNDDTINILFIFLSIGFFPLLFSGSYLNAPFFFSFLGFAFSIAKQKKL